eukprot:NODE_93_length_21530_cov_0.700387.p4 type:complete len:640 gc:universal NODE_93_length_21530_cov_0.700387:19399-21318(+)
MRRLQKILIANRGEIACRISRTAKLMGIDTYSVYTDPDKNSQHVINSDFAIPLANTTDYLNQSLIVDICKKYNIDGVHPGYGFLSENANFAKMLTENKINWIGPPSTAIAKMGNKAVAKDIMLKAGVRCTPGYFGDNQDSEFLLKEAKKIKFPVLIKPVNGGGGKGMRIVEKEGEFLELLSSCQREAKASFGNDQVLLEKYITQPRHIEVQVFADKHGNCVHLFERDCSVQRRHQKIIEEAPAPHLTWKIREELGQTAIRAAKAVNYVGAGTVEFIFDTETNEYYFMEMNCRLQVEHCVTEMITKQDLVEWQFRIANGEKLPLTQDQIKIHGHAMESRIYAENTFQNFMPDSGKITYLRHPENARVESHVKQGDEISIFYDPMISKLIVEGKNRMECMQNMSNALKNYHIVGVHTNIELLKQLCKSPAFQSAKEMDTNFLAKNPTVLEPPYTKRSAEVAALSLILKQLDKNAYYISRNIDVKLHSKTLDKTPEFKLSIKIENGHSRVSVNGHDYGLCEIKSIRNDLFAVSHSTGLETIEIVGNNVIFKNGEIYQFEYQTNYESEDNQVKVNLVKAPMPSKIIKLLVKSGDEVDVGQSLIVIEAMKMEHVIKSTLKGSIKKVNCEVAEMVTDKKVLIELE